MNWKLAAVLDRYGLTPLQVEREAIKLGLPFGKNVIYRLVKGEGPELVSRSSLGVIIAALRSLTGEPIQIADILSLDEPMPSQAPEADGRGADESSPVRRSARRQDQKADQ